MADPLRVISVKPVEATPTVTKITYIGDKQLSPDDFMAQRNALTPDAFMTNKVTRVTYKGSAPVSTEQREEAAPTLVRNVADAPNLNESPEQKFFGSFKYAPYVMSGLASPLMAGRSLAQRALISSLLGAGGEGAYGLAQVGAQDPNAPKDASEALSRMGTAGMTQGGAELGFGLLAKPLQFLMRGIANAPTDELSSELIRLNRDNNLRMTYPEIAKSGFWGKMLQRVGSSGVLGQPVASAARAEGEANATSFLNHNLDTYLGPALPAQDVGEAVQRGTQVSGSRYLDHVGAQLRNTVDALKGVPVNIANDKQEAQRIFTQLNQPNQFASSLTSGGPSAAKDAATRDLGWVNNTYQNLSAQQQQQVDAYLQKFGGVPAGQLDKVKLQVLGAIDPTAHKILADFMNLPDQVPFGIANSFKQRLNKLIPDAASVVGEQGPSIGRHMNKFLTGSMEQAADVANPSLSAEWKNYRDAYKSAASMLQPSETASYKGKFIQALLNTAPEKVLDHITTGSEASTLRTVLQDMSQHGSPAERQQAVSAFQNLQRLYLQRLMATPQVLGPAGQVLQQAADQPDLFGLKGRLAQAKKYGALQEMFRFQPEPLHNLQQIAEAMDRVQRIGGLNTLGQSRLMEMTARLVLGGTGFGIGAMHSPGAGVAMGAGFEAIPSILTKVIYSPRATQVMLQGLGGLIENPVARATAVKAGQILSPQIGPAFANIFRAFQIANIENNPATSVPLPPVPKELQ